MSRISYTFQSYHGGHQLTFISHTFLFPFHPCVSGFRQKGTLTCFVWFLKILLVIFFHALLLYWHLPLPLPLLFLDAIIRFLQISGDFCWFCLKISSADNRLFCMRRLWRGVRFLVCLSSVSLCISNQEGWGPLLFLFPHRYWIIALCHVALGDVPARYFTHFLFLLLFLSHQFSMLVFKALLWFRGII